MKNCSYCGRENTDAATHCVECGTGEFTDAAAQPELAGIPAQEPHATGTLARDFPKPIVIAGIWTIFLPSLLANLYLAFAALTGEIGVLPGALGFFLSLGWSALCGYLLLRAIKNYKIHRDRLSREMAKDACVEAESLASPGGLNPS